MSFVEIDFYETARGACPIKEFIDALPSKQKLKVLWMLQLVEDEGRNLNTKYLKKLSPSDLWEIRVMSGNFNIRLLGFFHGNELMILNHGFIKKTQKVPQKELNVALERYQEYTGRKK